MDLQRFQLLLMLDSFVHQASRIAEIIQLVDLYVLVSMMQVLSSASVFEKAGHMVRLIADSYLAPNKTVKELHRMIANNSIDASREFSDASRDELWKVRLL